MGIRRYIEIDTQRFSDSEKDPVQETADMKKPGHPGFFCVLDHQGRMLAPRTVPSLEGPAHIQQILFARHQVFELCINAHLEVCVIEDCAG